MTLRLPPAFIFTIAWGLHACTKNPSNPDNSKEFEITSHKIDSCGSLMVNAATENDLNKIKLLVKNGCDVNSRQKNGEAWISPLLASTYHADDSITLFLLKHGADPNLYLEGSGTPFLYAAGSASLTTLKLLYAKGGDVHTLISRSEYRTPLDFAISSGLTENVRFLLEHGANMEGDSVSLSISALHRAIYNGRFQIAKLLLDHGADINGASYTLCEGCAIGGGFVTPLHIVVSHYKLIEPDSASRILELILDCKPNVNAESDDGLTALEYVCLSSSNVYLADRLIASGAKLETNGVSAIHAAAMFSNHTMVNYLLKKGADPNATTYDGSTALMVCYRCCGDGMGQGITNEQRLKTTAVLLEYGADPRIKNHSGESFVDVCKRNSRPEITQLMIEKGFLKQSDIEQNVN